MKHILAVIAFGVVSVGANAQIIMDQVGASIADVNAANAFASQDFEAANNAFDIAAIDDFTIGGSLILNQVETVTGGWNGFANYNAVTGYRVEIYSSVAAAASSLTGDIGSQLVAPGSATVNTTYNPASAVNALITLPVNIVLPAAGTYWVGVMVVNDFTNNGQVGVVNATFAGASPGGSNGFQANPAGGFGQGTSFPASVNFAYRLTAAPVPEPATMATLAAALGALALRRRKRS